VLSPLKWTGLVGLSSRGRVLVVSLQSACSFMYINKYVCMYAIYSST
jgi:hypothetical protein